MKKTFRVRFKNSVKKGIDIEIKLSRKNLKKKLLEIAKYKCSYCGISVKEYVLKKGETAPPNMATVDHITPKSKQGKRTLANCCICCARCNIVLGDKFDNFTDRKAFIKKYLKQEQLYTENVPSKWKRDVEIWDREQRKHENKKGAF